MSIFDKAKDLLLSAAVAKVVPAPAPDDTRPETMKMSPAEWMALYLRVLKDKDVDIQAVRDALVRALGPERFEAYEKALAEYVEGRTDWARKELPGVSKYDTRRIAEELESVVPGETDEDKIVYVVNMLADAIGNDERTTSLLRYARSRVVEAVDNPPQPPEDKPAILHPAHMISQWWGGVNMSGAGVDPEYVLEVSPDGRSWSDAPASWPSGQAGPGSGENIASCCAAAYQRADGTWAGGKYEWLPRPPRPRSYNNIVGGYNGWEAPSSGTKVLLWAHTANGNRVSTPVEVVWP
jgi:hypothetical protein